MGICSSCESASVATAKLILQHGQLVEFPYSVKVSHVLQQHPSCFICDSDSMEFQDFAPAMHADEELLPGQLYFALPLGKLRYPLQPEEMAALAVKASLALAKGGDTHKSCIKGIHELVNPKEQMRMGKKASRSSCKRSGRNFSASKSQVNYDS